MMLPVPRPTAGSVETARSTTGKSIGRGERGHDLGHRLQQPERRGERPMARPTGTAQSVPTTVETSTRPRVSPARHEERPLVERDAGQQVEEAQGAPGDHATSSAARARRGTSGVREAGGWRRGLAPGGRLRGRLRVAAPLPAPRRIRRTRPDRRTRSRNQLRDASAAAVSSTRKRCAQTTTGRQRSWSRATIMSIIASDGQHHGQRLALRAPPRSCTSRGRAGGSRGRPRRKASLIIRKNQPPAMLIMLFQTRPVVPYGSSTHLKRCHQLKR